MCVRGGGCEGGGGWGERPGGNLILEAVAAAKENSGQLWLTTLWRQPQCTWWQRIVTTTAAVGVDYTSCVHCTQLTAQRPAVVVKCVCVCGGGGQGVGEEEQVPGV